MPSDSALCVAGPHLPHTQKPATAPKRLPSTLWATPERHSQHKRHILDGYHGDFTEIWQQYNDTIKTCTTSARG